MKVTYDAEVDAGYIYLTGNIGYGEVTKTYSCDTKVVGGMVNLDFDAEGRLIGVEVLDAKRLLRPDLLKSAVKE